MIANGTVLINAVQREYLVPKWWIQRENPTMSPIQFGYRLWPPSMKK